VAPSYGISEAYTSVRQWSKPHFDRLALYHIYESLSLRRNLQMPSKKKSVKLLHCPTCGMLVQMKDEDFPFCSDRCRKIDLGKWAMGVYKISSPILDPEVLEDLGGLTGDSHDE
jgi:endogenous inhibitor of DNA gyrase (YacG/DUF329 family)